MIIGTPNTLASIIDHAHLGHINKETCEFKSNNSRARRNSVTMLDFQSRENNFYRRVADSKLARFRTFHVALVDEPCLQIPNSGTNCTMVFSYTGEVSEN